MLLLICCNGRVLNRPLHDDEPDVFTVWPGWKGWPETCYGGERDVQDDRNSPLHSVAPKSDHAKRLALISANLRSVVNQLLFITSSDSVRASNSMFYVPTPTLCSL